MTDYKTSFDSRIEESLEFLYNTSIPMFLNEINGPITFHNTTVDTWFDGMKVPEAKEEFYLNEYEIS